MQKERQYVEEGCHRTLSQWHCTSQEKGRKRVCVDYRTLNDVKIEDAYPLPRIDGSLDQLAGSCWFSCFDMNSGYWQVGLDQEDNKNQHS